jgi:hypothetical protein
MSSFESRGHQGKIAIKPRILERAWCLPRKHQARDPRQSEQKCGGQPTRRGPGQDGKTDKGR